MMTESSERILEIVYKGQGTTRRSKQENNDIADDRPGRSGLGTPAFRRPAQRGNVKSRPEPPERPVLARKPMVGMIPQQAQSSRPTAPEGNQILPRKAPAIGKNRPIAWGLMTYHNNQENLCQNKTKSRSPFRWAAALPRLGSTCGDVAFLQQCHTY